VLPVKDPRLYVAVGLPSVDGMGFLNVDDEEFPLAIEFAIDLVYAVNPNAERGSSITAEDKRHRTLAFEAR
jgi:hypothetical protein